MRIRAYLIIALSSLSSAVLTALTLALVGGMFFGNGDGMVDNVVTSAIPQRPEPSALLAPPLAFTVTNLDAGTVCIVEQGAALSGRSRGFEAAIDCEAVWPGLADARTWTENGDGTVSLSDDAGNEIVALAASRGFDFSSAGPQDGTLAWIRLP